MLIRDVLLIVFVGIPVLGVISGVVAWLYASSDAGKTQTRGHDLGFW